MRVQTLTIGLALLLATGAAHAQTKLPENPGPAIAGNSDPDMPAKSKMKHKSKSMKKMGKSKM